MKEEYVNKIRISLKNGTFYPTIVHALRNRWPLWWIRNRNLRALQLEERAYKKMKEKYSAPSFEVTELTDIITASSEQTTSIDKTGPIELPDL